jgi:TonB family protein
MPLFSRKSFADLRPLAALLAMALLALTPLRAIAADSPEWDRCRGDSGASQAQAIDACTLLLQASTNAPSRSFLLALRGRQYYLAGKYDQAIGDLDTAIGLDSELPQPVHYRGLSYAAKGDLDHAIADFSRVIKLDPAFSAAYFRRGLAYYNKGEFDKAISDLDQAIARDPADPTTYHYRGLSHFKRGEQALAIADYNEVIKRDAKDSLALFNRGNAYAANNDVPRAMADYDRAVALDPRDTRFLDARGELKRANGDLNGALADLDTVLQVKPADQKALLSRSRIYAAKGDAERSETDYAMVVSGLLQQSMLYPDEARQKRQEGDVRVTFAIDRDGKVSSSSIVTPSNNALLDREALAMIQRAQPFPSPSLIGKDSEEFATTIKFKLF